MDLTKTTTILQWSPFSAARWRASEVSAWIEEFGGGHDWSCDEILSDGILQISVGVVKAEAGNGVAHMVNHSLIISLIDAIDDFVSGKFDAKAMREQLRGSLTLLERGPVDFYSAIESAEVTLDLNQYTLSEADQAGADASEMVALRKFLQDGLSLE